ncbi:hypothetical protein [Rhodococcus sp. 1168]|uniref:hypothetical protein n=1 Tax=Rhodococcus sp. 1168 TaxID=2018041 RepID=UPI000A0D2CE0|nr:hypothetical protein [Rhodococcus sp. 1168]ORI15800.1 hypothetical protein BJI47_00430 [Rhodococcus sp. 1168]
MREPWIDCVGQRAARFQRSGVDEYVTQQPAVALLGQCVQVVVGDLIAGGCEFVCDLHLLRVIVAALVLGRGVIRQQQIAKSAELGTVPSGPARVVFSWFVTSQVWQMSLTSRSNRLQVRQFQDRLSPQQGPHTACPAVFFPTSGRLNTHFGRQEVAAIS